MSTVLVDANRAKAKIIAGVEIEPVSGCWLWKRSTNGRGYGRFSMSIGGAPHSFAAHRAAYELFRQPISPGLVLDHLCRRRNCCCPWHLEAVDPDVNRKRGRKWSDATHCKRGHSLSGENIRLSYQGVLKDGSPRPKRNCKTCERIRLAKSAAKRASRGSEFVRC